MSRLVRQVPGLRTNFEEQDLAGVGLSISWSRPQCPVLTAFRGQPGTLKAPAMPDATCSGLK